MIKNVDRLIVGAGCLFAATSMQAKAKKNVLFISVDDLKPLLGCYGSNVVKSPNIDRLAKMGTLMENAYTQQAVCAPSRFSVFTGIRPDTLKVWDIRTKFRKQNKGLKTIVDQFADNGYTTAGVGKMYHHEDQQKWMIPLKKADDLLKGKHISGYRSDEVVKLVPKNGKIKNHWRFKKVLKKNNMLLSTEAEDVPDDAYFDGAIANEAIRLLGDFKKNKTRFFLALGFKKPHLPFVAPKKYWDMYDRNEISMAEYRKEASGSPSYAYHTWGELKNYSDIPTGKSVVLKDAKQLELIHGYYACVSYMDAQLGKVLDKLESTGLIENTVICLWGDHGWHLGDHGMWAKHSNFEQATKVPMMVVAPGFKGNQRYKGMTELVDLAPTIFELSGVQKTDNLEGTSLVPAMRNVNKIKKQYSISQYPRSVKGKEVMGYSLRTERYRYTAWFKWTKKTGEILDTTPVDVELYDYKKDPLETKNFAKSPENKAVIKKHEAYLNEYLKRFNQI